MIDACILESVDQITKLFTASLLIFHTHTRTHIKLNLIFLFLLMIYLISKLIFHFKVNFSASKLIVYFSFSP